MKRVADLLGAGFLLILCIPVFAVIAVLIRLEGRGPIFQNLRRMGRGFRPFRVYKFRVCALNSSSDAGVTSQTETGQETRIGCGLQRLKLDSLPMLFNVLRGEHPELLRF